MHVIQHGSSENKHYMLMQNMLAYANALGYLCAYMLNCDGIETQRMQKCISWDQNAKR